MRYFSSACISSINSYKNKLGVESSSLATINTPDYTTIQWEDKVKNFGTASEGGPVENKFKNTESAIFIYSNASGL